MIRCLYLIQISEGGLIVNVGKFSVGDTKILHVTKLVLLKD
jgi:hypothetical protein